MRVGIWCDYGFTLEPSEGIGVFVDCLSRGMIRADPNCEVLLAPHPGQSSVLSSTVAAGDGRIAVADRPRMGSVRRRMVKSLTKMKWALTGRIKAGRPAPLASFVERTLLAIGKRFNQHTEQMISECDVWLLPYAGLDQKFSKPTVLVVHDLVSFHFSDVMKPSRLRRFRRQLTQQVDHASVVACMSEFIKTNDLCGLLKLPENRVQVFRAAVPDDWQPGPQSTVDLPAAMQFPEPYLFYPAAFRSYKNHRYLVELIAKLKHSPLWPMKIVFTGIRGIPGWLQKVVDEQSAQPHVVTLGKVTREQLGMIYRNAFATVVPSLYEQGSFPVMEAMQHQSVAVSSDIPSLREQFSGMGDAMLFFDPHECGSVLGVLEMIARDRSHVLAQQQAGFAMLRSWTWQDAAHGWLKAFEAITSERVQTDRSRKVA